ncbi:cytochrome P450 [Roridomyces roridus]|uniref:Cytochrome P450 n=1 Tax=Roridomyces roridus TaxID=1738132 RepID=A0AAD7F8X6_9AGAR|nr:cytochrome P450 [Roridomyces roridus]KAJ7617052.1 cytochrome P450 [Roridomyces roridus]
MAMDTQTSLRIAGTVFVLLLVRSVIRQRRQAVIRDILGPESKSWAFGNLIDLLLPSTYGLHEFAWTKLFGAVYRIKGCFGQDRLVISDPVALQHITNSPNFQLGPVLAVMRSWLYAHGAVITRHGEQHTRLRGALNVGFTASAVRRYRPVFENVAQWMAEQLDSADEVDVSAVLSGGALRAITDVALGCPIEDLPPEFVTLNTRLLDIASTRTSGALVFDALAVHVPKPLLRLAIHLPTPAFRALRGYKFFSRSEGWRIVKEKLGAPEGAREGDIYSLLLHSGEKDTKKTLLPGDLVAQTSLILLAGQDTTSNTLAFGLLELARRPDLQMRLREEIHSTISGTPAGSPIAYDTMPLLNAFIKEMLRMYPAAALSERVALEDTVIPLSAPGITTRSGKKLHAIPVHKGQVVMLAVAAYQRLDARWGANSEEFDPDRWLDGRVHQGDAIGPYANLLSFFAGPHTCLGWRFAILEMQTVVFKLLAEFSFSVPKNEKGPFRLRLATTLLPLDAEGAKGAKLCIRRVV